VEWIHRCYQLKGRVGGNRTTHFCSHSTTGSKHSNAHDTSLGDVNRPTLGSSPLVICRFVL
jgi:hypothetical protein